jgi:hypothetical protein
MKSEDAAGDEKRPDGSGSDERESQEPLRLLEIGLRVATLYSAYRHDEAATMTATALIEIIRLMRR